MRPSQAELAALKEQHGSVDRVALAIGRPRSEVRDWYAGNAPRHLTLVPDELSGDTSFLNEIPVIRRDYSHLDQLHVYALGDVHKGARMHDKVRWRDWLQWLYKNPGTSMIGTGDFLNAALKDSVSDVYEEVMTVGKAKRELRDELRPLAEERRLDLLIPGNHEDRITKAIGDCPIEDVCDQIEVPYAEAAALIVYTVGDQEYEVYVLHGSGGGMSDASLTKRALVCNADVYVSGHVHQQKVLPTSYLRREGDRMVRRHRYHCVSGSFLALEKYSIQKGYVPSRLGAPRIFLDGRGHDVRVSV